MEETAEAGPLPRKRPPLLLRFLIGSNPTFTIIRAIFWIVAVFLLFKYVLLGIRVTGHSMEPTYPHGEVKFVNRLAYRAHPPARGDVVAVASPEVKNILILKRVVGLPGEAVSIRNGIIYINGKALNEPYANGRIPVRFRPKYTLQPREYLVIGDNREISEGFFIYENQIVGRIINPR